MAGKQRARRLNKAVAHVDAAQVAAEQEGIADRWQPSIAGRRTARVVGGYTYVWPLQGIGKLVKSMPHPRML
eukprot:SAG25_NODE_1109_length_3950_cov_4.028564_5_plen_72_part_00